MQPPREYALFAFSTNFGTGPAEQITRYYDTFEKIQIKIIVYDDFKQDNAKVYRDVLCFLGIQEDFSPEFRIINPSATVRSKRLKVVLDAEPLNLHFQVRRIARVLKLIMPEKVFSRYKNLYDGALLNIQPRPSLDPEVRKQLMGRYKKEVEEVSRLLNRDLLMLV